MSEGQVLDFLPKSERMLSERELRESSIACRAFPANIAYKPETLLRVLNSYSNACRMLSLVVSLPPGARRDGVVSHAQKMMSELGFYRP